MTPIQRLLCGSLPPLLAVLAGGCGSGSDSDVPDFGAATTCATARSVAQAAAALDAATRLYGGASTERTSPFGAEDACAEGRLVRKANTVLDSATRLTWDALPDLRPRTIAEARASCADKGGRLPRVEELQALHSSSSGCGFAGCAFGGGLCGTYFAEVSRLPTKLSVGRAWTVNALTRVAAPHAGATRHDVRCVYDR